ncbi:MAG TPA: sigma-54 dependent transcriptional regulator [Bryobacteraceae bacterium]|nr:sigma-54 dependent transcriptional regulator [Bryobacteraceae bacterium]
MTATQDKRLLWIGAQPFDFAEWPLLSAAYEVESRLFRDAMPELSRRPYAAIVLHFPVSGWHPAELLDRVRKVAPGAPIFVHDPAASPSDAFPLARLGVSQFLSSDDDAVALIDQTREERTSRNLVRLAEHTSREEWERLLIGESHEMRRVCHIIRVVGGRRATVLVTGETGTGKELAARSLHLASPRKRAPWVAVNCSALPENLLEAELFGHVKGAFTGAIQNRIGRFEEAQSGTLFLDEIGDLALGLQAKLLRVVQERELQRLGSSETVRLDLRIVAATNCDLAQRVEQGRFREDLYYRLNVVPIHMPPLRQRRVDIPGLAAHFVQKICRLEAIPCKTLAPEAAERLCQHAWPGNVRQLENAVEMAVALSGDRELLDAGDFPLPAAIRAPTPMSDAGPIVSVPDQGMDYEQTLAVIERSILEQALKKTGGNKKAAADMLRLKRTTLSAKIRSLVSVAVCN